MSKFNKLFTRKSTYLLIKINGLHNNLLDLPSLSCEQGLEYANNQTTALTRINQFFI